MPTGKENQMSNIDVKQDSFCRFTKLRRGIKTADFMVILMDVYEQFSAQHTTNEPVIDEPVIDEPVIEEPAPAIKSSPIKKKDNK